MNRKRWLNLNQNHPAYGSEGSGKLFVSYYRNPWKGIVLESKTYRYADSDCVVVKVLPLFDHRGKPIRRREPRWLNPTWLSLCVGTIDLGSLNPDWIKNV